MFNGWVEPGPWTPKPTPPGASWTARLPEPISMDFLGWPYLQDYVLGEDGKLEIEDRIYDLPSGYTTSYSNLNENIRKNKERSRQSNQDIDMAINQSLMENLGISGL